MAAPIPPPLTASPRRIATATSALAVAAALIAALRAGNGLIAALLLAACGAALWAWRFAKISAQSAVLKDVEPPPAADFPIPTSLAFLSDPFAIPPPVLADMHAVEPFVETLCGQIEGIQTDVAEGVVSVVEKVGAIHLLSAEQRQRIGASLAGADVIREAMAVPGEIVARLEAMLADRNRLIAANFAGLQTLASEFQDLRTTTDVIARIADKAFFLSVNAAVEAHHQGSAGAAFGLIATEMRSLASQTAEGAREVGQGINAFAERMRQQLGAAMPDSQDGASVLGGLIGELAAAQDTISAAGGELDRVIQTLDLGHEAMVQSLSEILGNLQFQDVMRQRLEQVFAALRSLEDLVARSRSGTPAERSLLDVIEQQRRDYVMDSQRHVHNTVVANDDADHAPARKIELF